MVHRLDIKRRGYTSFMARQKAIESLMRIGYNSFVTYLDPHTGKAVFGLAYAVVPGQYEVLVRDLHVRVAV